MEFNGKVVSVETLHELASDNSIQEIVLGDSIRGNEIKGCKEYQREYDQWELSYSDGRKIRVYV